MPLIRKFSLLVFGLLVSLISSAQVYTLETIPDPKKYDANAYVSNPDGILSEITEQQLNNFLKNLDDRVSVEIAIVLVNSVGQDVDLDMFTNDLFAKWGIGRRDKDNGVLIFFVLDERFLRIETGYGVEGVLPDAVCARIRRDIMFPEFKKGDYDEGMLRGVVEMQRILTDPDAAAEVQSALPANSGYGSLDIEEGEHLALGIYLLTSFVFLLYYITKVRSKLKDKDKSNYQVYQSLNSLASGTGCLAFLFPLTVLPVYIWLKRKRKKLRYTPIPCPTCSGMMERLDDAAELAHLTASQKLEQQLKSVDYDVWYCRSCNKAYTFPYFNLRSKYTSCPKCAVRSYGLKSDVVLVSATTRRAGQGQRTYLCLNCNYTKQETYIIPRIQRSSGGGGSRGGGSSGGGSWGGGRSGGGGSSGRW